MGGHLRLAEVVAKYLVRESGGQVEVAALVDARDADWSAYDVVHGVAVAAFARKARRAGAKYVMTIPASWWEEIQFGYMTGRRGLYRLGQTAVYARPYFGGLAAMRLSDALAVSRSTAVGLMKHAPWERRKLYFMEYGMDTERFTPEGARDDGFIFYVGRLEKSKGVDTLLRATRDLPDRVVIAGEGSERAALEKLAGPNVEFVGGVSDEELLKYYRTAAMAVFPSRFEGFGLVALESLACGTPTAITSGLGFRVIPPAADLCEWFSPGDVAGCRRAIESMRGRKTPEWSRRAYEVVDKHHSARQQARDLLRLYESLAAGRGVPPSPPLPGESPQ